MSSSEQLRGLWHATSATVSGQSIPAADVDSIRLTITETRFTTRRGAETLFDSSYTADTTKSPMEIEMVGVDDFAGRPALGIYALEGEVLQLCYKMPGFLRPTEFASAPGSGAFLITLRRIG